MIIKEDSFIVHLNDTNLSLQYIQSDLGTKKDVETAALNLCILNLCVYEPRPVYKINIRTIQEVFDRLKLKLKNLVCI